LRAWAGEATATATSEKATTNSPVRARTGLG
jgi:hypothetical protein